jgi:hypothetical protein
MPLAFRSGLSGDYHLCTNNPYYVPRLSSDYPDARLAVHLFWVNSDAIKVYDCHFHSFSSLVYLLPSDDGYAAIRNSMVIFFHGTARDRPFLVTSPTS